ncbi:hypothetical protein V5G99_06110 [Bibersteinia trehalosi]|uniref:Tfp pilus assembly protein n=3 Tax=Bibersteinia trehalosi TaxID=47735 RepID=W0R9M7_BIBTR|nr:hypothetical protein [Bibersteinia trehalosi]AHG87015.1 Tfp pilus assembly protein [Bibersteinia trehalosi USDA-ARS-USMARC-190]RRN01537.1 hypothetical protein EIM44_08385 [Bibersteinia trehalosi]
MCFRSSMQTTQYGIALNENCSCCVTPSLTQWFETQHQLAEFLPIKCRVIYALPHQHIWRKIFFLPHLNKQNLHAKIVRLLKQELPLSLEEICFDYYIQPIAQSLRIALFALRKNYHTQLPLILSKDVIFDCELHCIARALLYLNQQDSAQIEQFYFPFEQQFFTLQNSGVQFYTTLPEQSQLLTFVNNSYRKDEQMLYLKALGASLWNGEE